MTADARHDSNVSLKMNSASCLNYRVIASEAWQSAGRWLAVGDCFVPRNDIEMNSDSCLNHRVIASRDSGVAISMRLRKLQEVTDYIRVICPSGAALRALVLLQAKLMLGIACNDVLMQ